jgi:hypothetical protein
MELDIDTISKGGVVSALLALIYYVGMKLVSAVDRLGTKVDDHTKVDLQHHGDVKESVAELHGKIDGLLDGQDRQARLTPALGVVRGPTNGGT